MCNTENLIITYENNIEGQEFQFMQIDLLLLTLVQLFRFIPFLLVPFSVHRRD